MGCKQVDGKGSKAMKPSSEPEGNAKVKVEGKEDDKALEANAEIKPVRASAKVDVVKTDSNDIQLSLKYDDTHWSKAYPPNTKARKVIEDFQQETRILLSKENEVKWYINKALIDLDDDITKVIPPDIKDPIEISAEVFGLAEVASNYSQIMEDNTELVGKPLSDPFEVIVFNKPYKSIQMLSFDQSEMREADIGKYSNISAHCNGENCLYLSGGEHDHVVLTDLWVVDLSKRELKRSNLSLPPKKHHSMVYVPHRYVFIVGGNTLQTFYYDTIDQSLTQWADLNIERKEPALCVINNKWLYAFSNVKKSKYEPLTFEKTNLLSSAKWEVINPKFSPSNLECNQKFFGVCDVSSQSSAKVLFLGGFMSESGKGNCFEYDIPTETVTESEVSFLEFDFPEKTFIPFNQHASFVLPNVEGRTPTLVVVNKKERKYAEINFTAGTPKNNLRNNRASLYTSTEIPQRKYFYNMPKSMSNSIFTSPKNITDKVYVNINRNETPKPKEEPIVIAPETKPIEPVIQEPEHVVIEEPKGDVKPVIHKDEDRKVHKDIIEDPQLNRKEIEVVKAVKKDTDEIGGHYIKQGHNDEESPSIPVKNFGSSLIRTSVVSVGKQKRLGIPGVKKNAQQLSGSKIGISNEFNKDAINDLKSSKMAGVEGKKISVEELQVR